MTQLNSKTVARNYKLHIPIFVDFQSLTTWDSGNQLTYPVKYIDIGYKDNLSTGKAIFSIRLTSKSHPDDIEI